MTDTTTKWYMILGGFIVLLFAVGIGSIEAWRHGTIHAVSGMIILALVIAAIGLIAGQMRQMSMIDGLVKLVTAWRGGERRNAETSDRRKHLDEDSEFEDKRL